MLVGHNPGMEDFIRYLTGELEPMPTAAIAVMSLEVDSWAGVTGRCGRLDMVLRPRDLMK
jgi:phosphohistidine phosphatase SixA